MDKNQTKAKINAAKAALEYVRRWNDHRIR